MSSKAPQHGGREMVAKLQNNAPKYLPLLRLEEPFCAWDSSLPGYHYQRLLEQLKSYSAVRQVDTKSKRIEVDRSDKADSTTLHRAKVYELRPVAREILEAEANRDDTLLCGHRSHIYNPSDIDGFGCKYCREQRKTIPRIEGYSKPQLERLL